MGEQSLIVSTDYNFCLVSQMFGGCNCFFVIKSEMKNNKINLNFTEYPNYPDLLPWFQKYKHVGD